jgi:hypothetical protein
MAHRLVRHCDRQPKPIATAHGWSSRVHSEQSNFEEKIMYTEKNFKTKKQLKEAVKAYHDAIANNLTVAGDLAGLGRLTVGAVLADSLAVAVRPVRYFQPGPFGGNEPSNGTFCCEGPHYPAPHTWYATCTAKDGVIVKVK